MIDIPADCAYVIVVIADLASTEQRSQNLDFGAFTFTAARS